MATKATEAPMNTYPCGVCYFPIDRRGLALEFCVECQVLVDDSNAKAAAEARDAKTEGAR